MNSSKHFLILLLIIFYLLLDVSYGERYITARNYSGYWLGSSSLAVGNYVFWNTGITWRLHQNAYLSTQLPNNDAVMSLIDNAYSQWENAANNCTSSYGGLTTSTYGNDGQNVHYWVSNLADPIYSVLGPPGSGRGAAVTYITVNAVGVITDADVIYEGYYRQGWDDGGYYDIWGIALHEIGHSIGLHHSEDINAVMYNDDSHPRQLTQDDIAGAKFLFDHEIIESQTLPTLGWGSALNFFWSVTIPNSVTVSIRPGTNITFANSTLLKVHGTFNAEGTSANNITLTRIGSSGTWDGILFEYYGNGTIDYCNISYAQSALTLMGVYSMDITNSYIHNNTQNGIFLNMSSPTINNNQIRNNGYYGIWAQNESSPSITGNIITGSSYAGIYADLYSVIGGSSPASNAIRTNGMGIELYDNSESYFGYSGYGASNSICSSTGYEVSATSSSYAYVQGNWWGSYPPNAAEFYADGTSYIDRSSPLSSDPNPTMQKSSSLAINTTGLDATQSSTIDWDFFFDSDLKDALQLFLAENYQDALNQFEKKFNKENNVQKKKYVLAKISQCYSKMGKKDFVDYLNNNVRAKYSKDDELYAVALELEYLSFLREGKFDSALKNLNYIKDNYSTYVEIYKHSLFNLSLVYGKYLGDIDKAKGYLTELETKYPDDRLVLNGKVLILGENAGNFQDEGKFKVTNGSVSNSEQYELKTYPNPFNPITKINFSIPNSGHVTLKVYDILGREVVVLVNKVFEAGKYEIEFDASNLPSGVYISSLMAGNKTLTKKMLLLK